MNVYTLICEVFTYVGTILGLILFIGYWTGADYFFNITKNHEDQFTAFVIGSFMSWFTFILLYIGSLINDDPNLKTLAVAVTGTVYMLLVLLFVGIQIFELFERSRKYFWNKRGKR